MHSSICWSSTGVESGTWLRWLSVRASLQKDPMLEAEFSPLWNKRRAGSDSQVLHPRRRRHLIFMNAQEEAGDSELPIESLRQSADSIGSSSVVPVSPAQDDCATRLSLAGSTGLFLFHHYLPGHITAECGNKRHRPDSKSSTCSLSLGFCKALI